MALSVTSVGAGITERSDVQARRSSSRLRHPVFPMAICHDVSRFHVCRRPTVFAPGGGTLRSLRVVAVGRARQVVERDCGLGGVKGLVLLSVAL